MHIVVLHLHLWHVVNATHTRTFNKQFLLQMALKCNYFIPVNEYDYIHMYVCACE